MTKHSCLGFLAVIGALILALPLQSFAFPHQMEALDRGLVVANVGKSGMLVSWRLLGTEKSDTEFNLYRDGTKIATIGKTEGTNYLDKDGKITSKYTVSAVVDSVEGAQQAVSFVFDSSVTFGGQTFPYKVLQLDRPPALKITKGDTICRYFPHDMSTGDLDGDGEYELVVKWDPHNYKDNSVDGARTFTGPVFIDAYKLNGTKLWRVSLGRNIRAGEHYTQYQVFDYDGDGKAEMIVKTADGTIDGLGNVIGDSSKDFRNDSGTVLTGPEYLTVFRGSDGAAITTIDYVPPRTIREYGPYDSLGLNWGDKYGNRSERYLAATAYLDGVHPSAIFARGYYTAAYVVAYDFDGKELKQRWFHKSETPGKGLFRQGNHNIFTGDIDGDGFDEIVYGAAALNHDGTVRYSTGLGHGDAGHLGDLDPDHPGLEYFGVHEYLDEAEYMEELRGADGTILMGVKKVKKDNGRGMAADVDSANRGYEFWSSQVKVMQTAKGDTLEVDTNFSVEVTKNVMGEDFSFEYTFPINFRVYFDGDLQDELLDGPILSKFDNKDRKIKLLFNGSETLGLAGGHRDYPLLLADLLGDWREEIIMRSMRDSSKVYILSTPVTTPYRVYTLMHDQVYREAIAWQNTGYNQPPHLGYYLPDMVKKLKKPNVYTVGDNEYVESPDAFIVNTGSGSEKQTVKLGKSIDEIDYAFYFCDGADVIGLPTGVVAKFDFTANSVKISGKPTEVGTFKFIVKTVGGRTKEASVKGEIVVKDTAKVIPKDSSKVDTSKTTPKDSSKTDSDKKDSSKVVASGSSIVDAANPSEGNGSTGNKNKGFVGEGYFDFKDSKSSSATWQVKSASKSATTMSVRFANGDSASRNMTLLVNGEKIGTVKMGPTGGWSTWNTYDIDIKLKKGKNTITLKSTTKSGGANVDAFFFDIAGVEAYTDKKSDALHVVQLNRGFFYRPETGALFTSVPGYAEILFYDISGTMRGIISGNVSSGESVLALDRGVLPEGMYVVKVKLDGKMMQRSLFVAPK